jgi:hypothetical protein
MTGDKESDLKSAFDLAMERMAQRGEGLVRLTPEQKQAIGAIESRAKAKIAEVEILFAKTLEKARESGDEKKIAEADEQMRAEIAKLKARAEEDKARARQGQV